MQQRILFLLQQVQARKATLDEYDELTDLIRQDPSGEVLQVLDAFHGYQEGPAAETRMDETSWMPVLERVLGADKGLLPAGPRIHPMRWWPAVAAALILVIAGIYLLSKHRPLTGGAVPAAAVVYDAAPGGKRAVLTLADGRRIVLDSTARGQLAQEGEARIVQAGNGRISYEGGGGNQPGTAMNVLSTPRGGQYQVVLPDGTQVWLNAASTLQYPSHFTGSLRTVSLTGEAYFEAAKNSKIPLVVRAGSQIVQVMGTHFNINAYPDEPAVTTSLLEGAVKVSRMAPPGPAMPAEPGRVLHPGEQGVTGTADGGILVSSGDMAGAVAWKNGEFSFVHADLRAVMRQIARWYDVDLRFEGKPGDPQQGKPGAFYFSGSTYMNSHLSEVLKVLELSGVRCRLEGKTLFVRL